MPRSKQYEVNEAFASSQTTIITALNDSNVHGNHVGAPPHRKKNGIHTGWCAGIAFGALCIAFILCVAFLNIPGVPRERTHSEERRVLRKQGYLRIYPDPIVNSFKTKFLLVSNIESPVQQLRELLSGYPEYTDSYTTCFVSIPTYNRPCYFEKEWLGTACSEENSFGYREINGMINPCILLTIENFTDWRPVVYVRSSVDSSWIKNYDPNFSNVGCMIKGKGNGDEKRRVYVYPGKGFPNQFFPVSSFNKSLYRKPSVMIQITNLPVGESIALQCWLRVSNAFMLEDDGEIVINITTAATFTRSTSASVQQSTATYTEILTETTAERRLPPTTLDSTPSTLRSTRGVFSLNQKN